MITQLVCNKQWYIQTWTFYWCCDDVDIHETVMRLCNHVVWLVYLSWPSMWWTCPFTPTQAVSWQLEWYMYTLSYISTHRQTCKVQWGSSSHASYLPSSYSLSLLFPEHDNTQLVYVEFNILLVFWWRRLWRRYIIMLFDLFIFLSWPSMWWTCGFTPTQQVSWQLE